MIYKEFNLEHARAGAPYCQRNGLSACIGIWDVKGNYQLAGVKSCDNKIEVSSSWTNDGRFHKDATVYADDLVMLPLGYCEGKPVFVGDEIINVCGPVFKARIGMSSFNTCTWPRTTPGVPTLGSLERTDIEYMLSTYRAEIEAYWKALDEFNKGKA
jgi:hypothetical protein